MAVKWLTLILFILSTSRAENRGGLLCNMTSSRNSPSSSLQELEDNEITDDWPTDPLFRLLCKLNSNQNPQPTANNVKRCPQGGSQRCRHLDENHDVASRNMLKFMNRLGFHQRQQPKISTKEAEEDLTTTNTIPETKHRKKRQSEDDEILSDNFEKSERPTETKTIPLCKAKCIRVAATIQPEVDVLSSCIAQFCNFRSDNRLPKRWGNRVDRWSKKWGKTTKNSERQLMSGADFI